MPALLLKLTDFKNRLALRASKKDVEAHKIPSADKKESITAVSSAMLKKGDIVIVKAGEQIPGDGEVIECRLGRRKRYHRRIRPRYP